jgi:tetratricopeptide (TPR) repeat protein
MLILNSSCNNTKAEWKRVCQVNTVAAYQQFLDSHPSSEYEAVAREKIKEIIRKDWEQAQSLNTLQSYQKFVDTYPSSDYNHLAIEKLITLNLEVSFNLISKWKFDEAKPLLEKVIQMDPGNPLALNNLGVLMALKGDIAKARSLIKQALPRAKSQFVNNIAFKVVIEYKSDRWPSGLALAELIAFQSEDSNTFERSRRIDEFFSKHPGAKVFVPAGEGMQVFLQKPMVESKKGVTKSISLDTQIKHNIFELSQ